MEDESRKIAKKSKSSFFYAFNLLPPVQREAMNTVYAFCRKTDDIVDEGDTEPEVRFEHLRKWRVELEKGLNLYSDYSLLNKLGKIVQQFNIPIEPFFDLIKGMEMDLQRNRYISIEDLLQYCYRVASTVGLMCIEIFGYKNNSTRNYAIKLGVALQLTNIIRDVKKDAIRGRIYLPQDDLANFNYSDNELMNNVYNDNFISLMKYEVNRAKEYFRNADDCLNLEDKPSMFPARAMQHIYRKLLSRIESKEYDVFSQNINLSSFEKIAITLGVWAKYSLVY
ncbi:presqualene diphosphate synthase HpnD [Bacteroidota bacterium]